jgi:hypothetical protein
MNRVVKYLLGFVVMLVFMQSCNNQMDDDPTEPSDKALSNLKREVWGKTVYQSPK